MQYQKNSSFQTQVQELFFFYDRAGIGAISKAALLSYFGTIDKLITQEWLNKILLPRGVSLKQTINFEQFLKIMQHLSKVPQQEEDTIQI